MCTNDHFCPAREEIESCIVKIVQKLQWTAFGLTGSHEIAQEVVQAFIANVLGRACKMNKPSFEDDDQALAYFRRGVVNAVISLKRRNEPVNLSELYSSPEPDYVDRIHGQKTQYTAGDFIDLHNALQGLPEKDRALIWSWAQGKTHKEISESVNAEVCPRAIGFRIKAVLAKLRANLTADDANKVCSA